MEFTELGTTGIQVSAVALGCMSLSPDNLEQSKATVLRAFELGINFFDTADVYNNGQSEEILGQALGDGNIPRHKVVIASKCGIVFQGMVDDYAYKAYDLSPDYIKQSCESSLTRLGTDYIDLYQLHRIDYLTHPEETARALQDLKSEGKIRHVGISNYTSDEIRALSAYLRLETLQTRFSLLELEPLETGLSAVCQQMKMNMLCYSPLHKAALTGKLSFVNHDWQEQREAGVVHQMQSFAADYGISLSQLSLAWLMQLPGGVIPLVGTANPAHITEAAASAGLSLARDDWYELLVIARGRPMPWAQRPYIYMKDR